MPTFPRDALGCRKARDVFLRDFVKRTPSITGIVMFTKVGPSGAKAGRVQFMLEFEPTDLVGLSGLALSWLDCDTSIIQFKLGSARTSYFLLQVFARGHLPAATPVAVPLLI